MAVINLPGDILSETVYNGYLIPYWMNTLESVGYQHIPIRDLKTGEIIGTEAVPQYEFPLENVSDLYLPASILSWSIIGLILQGIYNRWKRRSDLILPNRFQEKKTGQDRIYSFSTALKLLLFQNFLSGLKGQRFPQ